jgi:hypothetical protein
MHLNTENGHILMNTNGDRANSEVQISGYHVPTPEFLSLTKKGPPGDLSNEHTRYTKREAQINATLALSHAYCPFF